MYEKQKSSTIELQIALGEENVQKFENGKKTKVSKFYFDTNPEAEAFCFGISLAVGEQDAVLCKKNTI